jgi:hypothetical protein
MDKQQAKAMLMQMMNWDEAKFNEMEQWAKDECACPGCPTYLGGEGEAELAFCWASIGRAEKISEERNCVCGQCPVFNQSDFSFAYYCTRDSDLSQKDEMRREAAA